MPPSDQSVSNLLVHKDSSSPAHLEPVNGADVDRSNTLFVCLWYNQLVAIAFLLVLCLGQQARKCSRTGVCAT